MYSLKSLFGTRIKFVCMYYSVFTHSVSLWLSRMISFFRDDATARRDGIIVQSFDIRDSFIYTQLDRLIISPRSWYSVSWRTVSFFIKFRFFLARKISWAELRISWRQHTFYNVPVQLLNYYRGYYWKEKKNKKKALTGLLLCLNLDSIRQPPQTRPWEDSSYPSKYHYWALLIGRFQFDRYSVKRHSTLMDVTSYRVILYPRLILLFVFSAFQEKDEQYSVSAVEEHVLMAKESIQFCSFRIFKVIFGRNRQGTDILPC